MPRKPPKIEPIEGFEDTFIRKANALELATISDIALDLDKKTRVEQARVMAEISAMLVCKENGDRLFASADEVLEEDPEFLAACGAAALGINGIGEAPVAVKNSEAGHI